MILAKLKLDEETKLDFDIEVSGTAEHVASTRFVIEGQNFDIVCHCKQTKNGIEARIPKLKGIIKEGQYTARLEVVLNDKIFQPLIESVVFDPLEEVGIKSASIETVKEGIRVRAKTPKNDTSKNPQLNKALKEGCKIVNYGEYKLLKQGSDYIGLVTETKVLKSKKPHATLTGLTDELLGTK